MGGSGRVSLKEGAPKNVRVPPDDAVPKKAGWRWQGLATGGRTQLSAYWENVLRFIFPYRLGRGDQGYS